MMKNNQKGFTLIEILAAVTILGMLSVVAMVGINRVIQDAREKHYSTAEDQLKLAGQSYTQQNRSALPKAIGQKNKISLKTLVDRNYIKTIKDYSDNNCDVDKSYVQVFKYSQSDYSYVAYLDCPAYNSKEEIKKGSPSITISISDPNKAKKATATVKITDNEKLLSWSYIIYKDGEEVKNSGSTNVANYAKSLTETINLAKYTPGKVKVVVTATNIYGLTTTKSSDLVNFKDTQGPTCVIQEEDKKDNPKPWTKGPVTITIGCDDGDGSGCSRKEYTKTFKTTTDVGTITIKDKEGNETKCQVSVNVDTTAPTVPKVELYKWKNNSTRPTSETGLTKYTAGSWSNLNIYTKATDSKDTGSGFAKYQYTITGDAPAVTNADGTAVSIETNGTSTIKYRACDKLNNCSAYSSAVTIKLDKIAPTCTSSGGSTTWTNGNRTLTGTCSDTLSSCVKNASKTYTTDINSSTQGPGTVKDNAGNETTCPNDQTVKIDKTPPTQPTVGTLGQVSGSDPTGRVQTLANGSTDVGGSGVKEYRYLIKTTSGTPAKTDGNFTTSSTFTRSCGKTYYGFAIAVDNAGNRSTVRSLGTASDGADKPSAWSSCSTTCGTGTQTRTNTCALKTDLSRSCTNTSGCCNSKYISSYGAWSGCSAKCGGGTQTRTVYYKSSINGQDCGTTTQSQSCQTQDCCSSTTTTWGGYGACSVSCGNGTKTRSGTKYSAYDGRYCGTTSSSTSCYAGPCYGTNNCKIRGNTKVNTGYSWTCTSGHSHTTAYIHYCSDGSGNLQNKNTNPNLVTSRYVCPTNPYGPANGYMVITDPSWSLGNFK